MKNLTFSTEEKYVKRRTILNVVAFEILTFCYSALFIHGILYF